MRLIDADALYEKAASLEAQALNYVEKLMERDGREVSTEFRIWSAILAERTAFKHDVFDAPTIKECEREWTPVSKRVPNENKDYLTTTVNSEVYCDRWIEDNFNRTELVIAWMPLPEPYKEVDDADSK